MKRTLFIMAAVLCLCTALFVTSARAMDSMRREVEGLRLQAMEQFEGGEAQDALSTLSQLSSVWKKHMGWLEMVAAHSTLHEVNRLILEAHASLEAGETGDFCRAMALLGETLDHLCEEERLSWANLF